MNKPTAIAAALVLAVLIASALLWQRRMERALPPRVECADQWQAERQAAAFAAKHPDARVVPVAGTGSMVPYIPAASDGTIVALAVIDATPYADLTAGALCVYQAPWDARLHVLHQAAQRDAGGWIMTGLANDSYESAWRMTPANYRGRAMAVYVWPR